MLKIAERKHQSFTLIELLVVIAIIGVLASILITTVGPGKGRGRDARIIYNMKQVRNQAAIWESPRKTYAGLTCTSTPEMIALCDDIDIQCNSGTTCGGNNATSGTQDLTIRATTTEYCAYTGLNSGGWHCINEARGIEILRGGTNPGTAACAGTSYDCP